MKQYIKPEITVIVLELPDIVTASEGNETSDVLPYSF